jgi:hypothetical protein
MSRALATTIWSCCNNIPIACMSIYIALPIMLSTAIWFLEATIPWFPLLKEHFQSQGISGSTVFSAGSFCELEISKFLMINKSFRINLTMLKKNWRRKGGSLELGNCKFHLLVHFYPWCRFSGFHYLRGIYLFHF